MQGGKEMMTQENINDKFAEKCRKGLENTTAAIFQHQNVWSNDQCIKQKDLNSSEAKKCSNRD